MKKIIVIQIFLLSCLISYAETITGQALSLYVSEKTDKEKRESKIKIKIETESEKYADNLQLAMIYFENGEIDKAILELEKIKEEKRGFEYYFFKGKIDKLKGENQNAIKNLKKAEELNNESIEVKIVLFDLYSENSGFEKEREEKRNEILSSNLSNEEKELFKKLYAKYDKKNSIDTMGQVYTGITFTDNVKESKEKEQDWGSINGIIGGMFVQYGKNKKLYLAAAYKNTLYFSNGDESYHDFIITGEPIVKYKKWSFSTPTALRYSTGNKEGIEAEIFTGGKWERKIGKKSNLITGIDLGYKNNSKNSYNGLELYPYTTLKWVSRYKINYETELKLIDEIYNKEEYKNIGVLWKLKSMRIIKEKYKVVCLYGIGYNNYSLKVSGVDRTDIKSNINIEVEVPVIKNSLKSLTGFLHEHNNSKINSYDYSKNSIYIKLIKEF